jgi:DNA-binding transcriptional LysR family regulator
LNPISVKLDFLYKISDKLKFMIKLEYLRVFATVAETQALSEAAERLGRTPSAVSMTLKQIEESLGGPLFEGERKAALTPLGAFALRHARKAVAEHDTATAAIQRFARGEAGEVRIAAVPSAATRLLPGAVARLRRQRPDVRINLRDIDSTSVVRAVEQKSVDIGIASPSSISAGLAEELLFEDPFVLVCRKDHPITRLGRAVTWSDVDPSEFIANGLCASIPAPELAELARNAPLMVHNVSSLTAFVSAGFGVTLLPTLAITDGEGVLQAVPIEAAPVSRRLAAITRLGETLAPSATAFLAEIRLVAKAFSQTLPFDGNAEIAANGDWD